MKQGYEQLYKQVMSLDLNARAELARDLLESLETLSKAENERLWLEVAQRRQTEARQDPSIMIPAEEVFKKLNSNLR
ncbi:MAG: addiction module protein [Stenotrophobium sp.]